ncbi:ATP-grasp domain-containing protein [Sinosporangium siamense]|uniref:ATP-grasp domain-containing protein n=1 Tax=Sinosporangium siamense TaxID=1367973 RepID=A0A919V3T5_9ACTN|nr:hypothetical protein [Sinosporangium siamense]GII89823.1 ATP-grasp domain-containing protein [Sinosporangium siamense]
MGIPVAYATFADPSGDDDEREVAIAAWRQAGIEGHAVRWDDPEIDWSSFKAVVIRSTWDYVERRDEFTAWAHRVEGVTRLFNPAAVIERNTDKTYLRDLRVPTVPTYWGEGELPEWPEYVVKPAVSAGARDTIRTLDRDLALAHAATLRAAGRTAMIQPYLHMVETEGETSLIYFGGRFSHAIRRLPMLAVPGSVAGDVQRREAAREPDADQRDLAEALAAELPDDVLYARIDLVRLADGSPALIELELTEPYLYLKRAGRAPAALAEALAERL